MGIIENRFFMKCINLTIAFCLSIFTTVFAQSPLVVMSSSKEYKNRVKESSDHQMLELKYAIPQMVYDLRYATPLNFMHRRMYPKNTNSTFLRKPAALALLKVQHQLNKMRLGIKVFDAYRPYSVSEKFWELLPDDRFVANPIKGSNHNRGTAVDLTIIHLSNGQELDMGTDFDHFSDSAFHSFKNLPEPVLQNRKLLRSLMEQYGFKALETEWWHYTFVSSISFEVLNLSFKQLLRR